MRSVSMVQPHQSDRVMATPQSAVASSAQVAAQAQERLAAGLAMIAGYVDAYGYITFKTFVSFMSGNTTQTGFQTGQGHVAAAMPSLLPIGSFVIGAFTGTLLTHAGTPQARRRLFGVVAAVLAVRIRPPLRGWGSGGGTLATPTLAAGKVDHPPAHFCRATGRLTLLNGA